MASPSHRLVERTGGVVGGFGVLWGQTAWAMLCRWAIPETASLSVLVAAALALPSDYRWSTTHVDDNVIARAFWDAGDWAGALGERLEALVDRPVRVSIRLPWHPPRPIAGPLRVGEPAATLRLGGRS